MEFKNLSALCRCCLKNGSINIFETQYEGYSLAVIIERCTGTKISDIDKLPHNICQLCFDELVICHSFINKYKKSQESLLKVPNSRCLNEIKDYVEYHTEFHENSRNGSHSISDMYSSEDEKPLLSRNKNQQQTIQFSTQISKTSKHCKESIECLDDSVDEEKKLIEIKNQNNTSVLEKVDKSSKNYVCLKCKECFSLIKLLKEHCKDSGHPLPRRYSCEICPKKFSTKTMLKVHLRTHSKEQPYICKECGMKFSLRSNLQRHMRKHTGEKAFFCEICGRGFIQKHTMIVHMRIHSGETPYVCQQCGKGYKTKPLLTQHLKKHSGLETYYRKHYLHNGGQKVECTICKKLLTKSGLYTHMKVQHGDGLKKFLCNLCGKTYSSKKSLDTHMNVHTKKINYRCDICLKTFCHQNYLKTHLRIHSGEKPHCCEVCGKTFTQKAHLDCHMRTHTGSKPFSCTYCKKSFALNGNLKVHMRIHTGETPHQCVVCNKGFFDSSNKKKHESAVHQLHKTAQ